MGEILRPHAPLVTLNVPDNRLDQPGWVHRWYPHEKGLWENSETDDVYRWPKTNLITLKPLYPDDPAEAQLAQWDTDGTNASYVETEDVWPGGTGISILQQNPNAMDCILTSTFTPDPNQSFWLDLWLCAVMDDTWYAELYFCQRFGLHFLYNGVIQLFRNYAVGEDDPDWRYAGECETVDSMFNKHIRIGVYPTNQQMLLIEPQGFDPIQYVETEAEVSEITVNLGDPEEADYTMRTICPASEVQFTATGGAFYFSYRYMAWPTSGEWVCPEVALPWEEYDDVFDLLHSVGIPREGYDFITAFEIIDEDDVAIASPPVDPFRYFRPRVQFTGCDAACSPELYWTEMQIAPTSQAFVPAPPFPLAITEPERLQRCRTQASIEDRHQVNIELQNADGAVDSLADLLHVCSTVQAAGATVWKGYLQRRAAPEEQSGKISLVLDGQDPLDRLNVPLTDSYIGDGRIHTAYVEDLFQVCGLAPADYVIAADPDNKVLPESIGLTKDGVAQAYFRTCEGKTAREMVEYICRVWSGWELYCTMDGLIHYAPQDTSAAPTRTLYGYESLAPDALKYYSINPQRDEERFYNYIVVIGQDIRGQPIVGVYYDPASVSDVADANFLGYERLLIVVDSTLCTEEHVEAALDFIIEWHSSPLEEADATVEFDELLEVRDILAYDGSNWQVRSLGRQWEPMATRMAMLLRKVS